MAFMFSLPTLISMIILVSALSVSICIFVTKKKPEGNLVIDNSIPEDGPYLFLEINKDVPSIAKKRYILLKVDNRNLADR